MKKKIIIDLIKAHYEDDPRLFFRRSIDVLKEFKQNGDDLLVSFLDTTLKGYAKIAPKRKVTKFEETISFEDAADLNWVPMENEKHE